MSSFCIRQSDTITLAKGTSPYIVSNDQRYHPDEISRYLTETFITPDLVDHYRSLRQAEADAVQARIAWLAQLALDLGPAVDAFLDSFPTTHPEVFV